MSAATLLIRERNPDDDFVLRGEPAIYTERRSFYPTNSDITTTTRNLSQHEYRGELYRDILREEADQSLRSSLRSNARNLRLVSTDLKHNLEQESTAKKFLPHWYGGSVAVKDDVVAEEVKEDPYRYADGWRVPRGAKEDRSWLTDSEWNTASGHHVTFCDNVPRATLLNRDPSASLREMFSKTGGSVHQSLDLTKFMQDGERLRRTVNLDMDLAQVPLTRFTRKDLMASEFFPVTMSCSVSEADSRPGSVVGSTSRSRSRTRSPQRFSQSARHRSRTPERVSDNFRSMKRLEKLYLITSEAPTVASAPPVILSPYQEEIARLRMERLRLEGEHLKELSRLTALETTRGPKPKWYELKDTQFHFEAAKNNDVLRSLESMNFLHKARSEEPLSQSQPDLYTLRMRTASFS